MMMVCWTKMTHQPVETTKVQSVHLMSVMFQQKYLKVVMTLIFKKELLWPMVSLRWDP